MISSGQNSLMHSSRRGNGFTLMEVMIAMAIIAILVAIAFPSYQNYVVRSSRSAAQTELLELANLQEKIYLNSNSYTAAISSPYSGFSTGGLGKPTSQTADGKYALGVNITPGGQTFILSATPVAGTTQDGDGAMSISSDGVRLYNGLPW
jgi:type IV pilus assembly protein PilE